MPTGCVYLRVCVFARCVCWLACQPHVPQGLCAALDTLESAVAVAGDAPIMNGVYYTSMQYFREFGVLLAARPRWLHCRCCKAD